MNSTVWAISLPLAAILISIALKTIKPRTVLNGCKEKFLRLELLEKRQNDIDIGIARMQEKIEAIADDVKEIKDAIFEIRKKVKY